MGPYCKFCGRRCFVPIIGWPKHIGEAYGRYTIAATCRRGQEFEKERLGYCWDDVEAAQAAVAVAEALMLEKEGAVDA